MVLRKTIEAIVLVSTIGLTACYPGNFVEGEVTSEYGNVARIVESSGAVFGNESVRLGNPHYGLHVETSQGNYTIEVEVGDRSGSEGMHTVYNLAATIEEGTRIRFPLEYGIHDLFSADNLGIVDPDDIQILRE